MLTRVTREWTKIPLWITENGIALHDYVGPDGRYRDPERIDYFATHFRAAARAFDQRVPLDAYIVWSLMDNFGSPAREQRALVRHGDRRQRPARRPGRLTRGRPAHSAGANFLPCAA